VLRLSHHHASIYSVLFRMYPRSFAPMFADCSHAKHYPRAV
jgi:hypothetical protein